MCASERAIAKEKSDMEVCHGRIVIFAVVTTTELASIGFHLLPFYFRSPVHKIEETSLQTIRAQAW
jgi:hypothetical protein